jgi:signal peptidase
VSSVLVAIIAVVAVALVGMRIMGYRTFTVISGSMSPEYPVGSLIYVKPVNYYDLKKGDVISYVANDNKTVVTHRIVDIQVDEKDASVWRFVTQGDANNTPDAKAVHYKNVLGTPIITIPFIGYFVHNVQQPPGIYIALVVGTLLLAWTFLPGTLEERRKTARKSVA